MNKHKTKYRIRKRKQVGNVMSIFCLRRGGGINFTTDLSETYTTQSKDAAINKLNKCPDDGSEYYIIQSYQGKGGRIRWCRLIINQ